jgi:hypothetical protein
MTAPKLSRDTRDGRVYSHPQRASYEVPSVTNITGCLDKSKFLTPWAAKACGEAVSRNVDTIVTMREDPEAIVDWVRTAPNRNSDGSAAIGDLVHLWIDDFIGGGASEPSHSPDDYEGNQSAIKVLSDPGKARTARHMFLQFLAWDNVMHQQLKWEWLFSEVTVWSEKYAYAGTLDWMARATPQTGAPYVVLGDTKTGKNTYPEVGMQLAALFNADYAFDHNGEQFELPEAESFGVLHVRPRFARLQPVEHIDECFKAFLGLRDAFEWNTEIKDNVLKMGRKVEISVAGQ